MSDVCTVLKGFCTQLVRSQFLEFLHCFDIDSDLKGRGKRGPVLGGTEYRLMPSACRLILQAKLSIPRESCTNAKAKYSSSVVPPDPSVHFYHCSRVSILYDCIGWTPAYITCATYPKVLLWNKWSKNAMGTSKPGAHWKWSLKCGGSVSI